MIQVDLKAQRAGRGPGRVVRASTTRRTSSCSGRTPTGAACGGRRSRASTACSSSCESLPFVDGRYYVTLGVHSRDARTVYHLQEQRSRSTSCAARRTPAPIFIPVECRRRSRCERGVRAAGDGDAVLIVSSYPPRHCGIGAYARDQVASCAAPAHEVTVLSPPDGDGDIRVAVPRGRRRFREAARIGARRSTGSSCTSSRRCTTGRGARAVAKVVTSRRCCGWCCAAARDRDRRPRGRPADRGGGPTTLLLRLAFRAGRGCAFHTDAERAALRAGVRLAARPRRAGPHQVAASPCTRRLAARRGPRRRWGSDGDGPVLVCAGFLQPSKGFDRAVAGVRRVGRRSARARLVPGRLGPRRHARERRRGGRLRALAERTSRRAPARAVRRPTRSSTRGSPRPTRWCCRTGGRGPRASWRGPRRSGRRRS